VASIYKKASSIKLHLSVKKTVGPLSARVGGFFSLYGLLPNVVVENVGNSPGATSPHLGRANVFSYALKVGVLSRTRKNPTQGVAL
jgi:hypothetical protein